MVKRYRRRTNSKTLKRNGRKNTHRRKSRRKIMQGGGKTISLLTNPSKKHPKGMLHAFNQKKMNKNVNSLTEMLRKSTLRGPATRAVPKTVPVGKTKKKKGKPTSKKVDELTKLASKLKIKPTEEAGQAE